MRQLCGNEGNLESSGQNNRLRMGVVMAALALCATIYVVQGDIQWGWRALLFFPFFMAAFGAWQGLFRICPGMAMKGVRETPTGGEERVSRASELDVVRRNSRIVFAGSIATALFSTLVVLVLP